MNIYDLANLVCDPTDLPVDVDTVNQIRKITALIPGAYESWGRVEIRAVQAMLILWDEDSPGSHAACPLCGGMK